ncbi:MAG: hypothetical protein KatS3mg074_539 [Meiothermus sp.]|nr:MAG: hypothetical protein KatS3mg074_539 [Meiothermus sp.]
MLFTDWAVRENEKGQRDLPRRGDTNFTWMVIFERRSYTPSSGYTPGVESRVPITGK